MSIKKNLTGQNKPEKIIYQESFVDGPGGWTTGKNDENGSCHRNVFGHRGEICPLEWSPEGGRKGGYAYSESPWYFDDNHGEFMWFYIALSGRSKNLKLEGKDLRDATVHLTLRGKNLNLKGAKLIPWIEGHRGHKSSWYTPGNPLYCWALTSQSINLSVLSDEWNDIDIKLVNDEDRWDQMGIIRGGLAKKIVVIHSRTVATGSLDNILKGNHYVAFGFLLGPLDPNDLPSGRIELDEISIYSN